MVAMPGAQLLQLPCSKNTIRNGIETQPPNPGYTRNIAHHFFFGIGGRLLADPSGWRVCRLTLIPSVLGLVGLLTLTRRFRLGILRLLQDCPGNSTGV